MIPDLPSTSSEPRDSPDPPVFRLTDDAFLAVLQHILADSPIWGDPIPAALPITPIKEDNTRVLATLLSCAQVCRKWRSLMAASPFLWANSVDLDVLSLKTPEWVAEFMFRTSQAPLRVYSLVPYPHGSLGTSVFALSFLNEHWSRAREVTAHLSCTYEQFLGNMDSDIPVTKKLFLKQPAPLLENCTIHLHPVTLGHDHPFRAPPPFLLFEGHTPVLRKFESCIPPGFLTPHSVANLRHLKASFNFVYPNVLSRSISAFKLESLYIVSYKHANMESHPNVVLQLPNLRRLTIVDGVLNSSLAILRRIRPSPGCALRLEVFPE